MKTNALGFIGGGRITKIFLNAFTNAEVELQSVVVYDSNPEVLASLKEQFPFIETGELLHAASQQTVFIALHPPVIMETLDIIAEVISEETELISLAPKITIEKIASKVSSKYIARMIPNATSYINEGYNPIAFAPDMEKEDRKEIKKSGQNHRDRRIEVGRLRHCFGHAANLFLVPDSGIGENCSTNWAHR